jgi:hypothetical protein
MSLTSVEANEIRGRIRELRLGGDPMAAMKLQQALDAGEMPDQSELATTDVRTDAPVKRGTDLSIPPRYGKGSGKKIWAAFAAKVTDVDGEVLDRMQRDDIVKMLVAKGNIPDE